MQKIKEKYSLWEMLVNYIKNMCNRNLNMHFHSLPSDVIDVR